MKYANKIELFIPGAGLMKADMQSNNSKITNRKLKQLMESSSGETFNDEMLGEIVENCDIESFT